MKKIIIILIAVVFATYILKDTKPTASIISKTDIDMPSGSGIAYFNSEFMIIGDDTPWLYSLDKQDNFEKKVLVTKANSSEDKRVKKSKKLDFEDIGVSVFNEEQFLVIVSSGSKQIYRDSIFILNDKYEMVLRKNIRGLYNSMIKTAGIKSINIEGYSSNSENVFFAHRGNHDRNIIFTINKDDFYNYLFNDASIPKFRTLSVNLPRKNGLKAGFSAIDYVKELESLIFTASIEGNKNSYYDGEVLGSYIGILPLNKPSDIKTTLLLDENGKYVKTKLEGVAVSNINTNSRELQLYCVSDNDNGKTEFFKIKMSI